MEDKNNLLKPRGGFLKPFIIAVAVIAIAWVIGKGFLSLIASAKSM